MDYYDYNVTNASAAPGSFFSISHLMWIPSLLRPDFEDEQGEHRIEEEEDGDEGSADVVIRRRISSSGGAIGDEGIDPGSNSMSPESEDKNTASLGSAMPIMSDDEPELRSDTEDGKDNKVTEKKQLATAQYYKNYYDQMDDIQFADEEDDAV